jgi:hypothetical protein
VGYILKKKIATKSGKMETKNAQAIRSKKYKPLLKRYRL